MKTTNMIHPTTDPNVKNRIHNAIDKFQTQTGIDKPTQELLKNHIFIKICNEYNLDPTLCLDDWIDQDHEARVQRQDDRNYDHWGYYDRDPDR